MGGWPQLTYDIATKLEKRGHDIHVLTSKHEAHQLDFQENNIRRVLNLNSPDHEHYHLHYSLFYPYWSFQNRNHLKQAEAQVNPDIVFINCMWNMSKSLAMDSEYIFRNRVIYYMANTWPSDLDAHSAYWTSSANRPVLSHVKFVLGQPISKVFLRKNVNTQPKFSCVLCVSKFIQNYMVTKVGIPIKNTVVVYNGIDLNKFKPKEFQINSNKRLELLYAGGLLPHKGVITAIEAMNFIVNDLGIRNVHLSLLGGGHPHYVDSLKDLVHSLEIIDYVTFLNRVPRDEMPRILLNFDVLLFPSIGPEALARIVQEAMASGLVVIGTTMGGTPEILEDGVNGLTFEAGNSLMLAEKIILIEKDRSLLYKYGKAGIQTVKERFSIDRMVNEIEYKFDQIINEESI